MAATAPAETAPSHAVDARDAGRAWASWLLAALFFFYAFLQRVSPSVMVDELMAEFAVGGAILGHLSACYFYGYAGLQLPIGILMDRVGPRRLMAAGALVAALGSAVFAAFGSLEAAYLGRFLVGVGTGFSFVGGLTVVAQWFPSHRFALLGGGIQAFGMMGAFVGQAPLSVAVTAVGWRHTLGILAVVGLVLAACLFAAVRDRPHPTHRAPGIFAALRQAFSVRETWLCSVFGLAMTGPVVGFAALWCVPYLMQVHAMDKPTAASFTSLMFLGWGIGAIVQGAVSDRLRRRRAVMLAGAALATAAMSVFLYAPGLGAPVRAVLLFAMGFGSSTMIVGYALVREANPPAIGGTVMGFVNMSVVGSGALYQPLIGALLDAGWDGGMAAGARVYSAAAYDVALIVLPAVGALGFAAAWLARETPQGARAAA